MSPDFEINFTDPQFTHGEAVEVSGVPSKQLNNWIQREVIHVGEMHRTGRRLFSPVDLLMLKIMGELTQMVGMPPASAADLASYAVKRASEMSERDDSGMLKYKGLMGEGNNRAYLVTWFDGEGMKAKVSTLNDFFGAHSIPHAVVVLPLDDIVMRVMNLCADILERE